jgi:hypothetical protein
MSSASAGVGSALPSQAGVTSGWALTTDGTTASWASVGGGGVSLGAFSSTPSADGLTLTGSVLNMDPADGTHPGGVSTAAQTFAGAKTFSTSVLSDLVAGKTAGATNFSLGNTGGFPGLWFGTNADSPSASNPSLLLVAAGSEMRFDSTASGYTLGFYLGGTQIWKMNIDGSLQSVVTGVGIKLKSPDGTTYTATMANGGTWSIA